MKPHTQNIVVRYNLFVFIIISFRTLNFVEIFSRNLRKSQRSFWGIWGQIFIIPISRQIELHFFALNLTIFPRFLTVDDRK